MSMTDLQSILEIDLEGWRKQGEKLEALFEKFGNSLPKPLQHHLSSLTHRLGLGTNKFLFCSFPRS